MDDKKIDKLIDTFDPNRLDKTIKALGEMSDTEFARASAKVQDKKAFDDVGLERITLFLKGQDCQSILLIKPNAVMPIWTLNLGQAGCISLEEDAEPTFTICDIASECYRLTMTYNGTNYWLDLIDEKQAQDLAGFLGIGIATEC
ncbi:hypothetical protein [Vibrio sp. TRT 29B02]|uniref:hypothetical protein n=1 Tax=Vibrio sp. TRT 29B02 TaxID=3418508 RepID=UPI003CF943EE